MRQLHTAGFAVLLYSARLAARAGHGDAVAWVVDNHAYVEPTPDTVRRAGMPGGLQTQLWANAAHAGHVGLMRGLMGSMVAATPQDLQAVAHGCSLGVLCECILKSGSWQRGQAHVMAGAVSSPTPDWRDKVKWLLQPQFCSPIDALDKYSARSFVALPDAEQRLEWLEGQGYGLRACGEMLRAAVEAGRAELVGKLPLRREGVLEEPENAPSLAGLVTLAVQEGHLGVARELRGRGVPVDVCSLAEAAGATGRADVVQWALGVMKEEEDREAAAAAAEGGDGAPAGQEQQEPLQGARDVGDVTGAGQESGTGSGGEVCGEAVRITDDNWLDISALWNLAIESGSLELVQWLHARGVDWDAYQLACAAKSGNEVLVERMVEHGYEMTEVGWEGLGFNGELHWAWPCLGFLFGCMHEWGGREWELELGNTVLSWCMPDWCPLVAVLEYSCTPSCNYTVSAARLLPTPSVFCPSSGNVYTSPVRADVCPNAGLSQTARVRCPLIQDYSGGDVERCPYLAAAEHGDLAMLRCLRRVGCPLPVDGSRFAFAVEPGVCLEVLQLLLDLGFPADWDQVEEEDKRERPAWRHKWGERSVWIHGKWRQARAQAREQVQQQQQEGRQRGEDAAAVVEGEGADSSALA